MIDDVPFKRMLDDTAECMAYELSKLTDKEKITYLRDLLLEIDESSLKAYWLDFGCGSDYADDVAYRNELAYWANRPL
jgi:hypothetical protein